MEAQQFAYWLQGFAEVNGEAPTKEQWGVIKEHLNTVFHKVTPSRSYSEDGIMKQLHNTDLTTPVLPYDMRFPQTTVVC